MAVPEVTVLDGPMGTELSRRGVALPLPGWSAHALDAAPEMVALVHHEYALAGATIHTANTFRTKRRAVGDRWEGMARHAMRLARASIRPEHRLAGSLAPLEDCYRPDQSPGRSSRSEHRELARVLADEGADLLLCETFSAEDEAVVAVEEAARTGIETWIALTAGRDGSLMTPRAMAKLARTCASAGAHAVLVNCTPASDTLRFVEAIAGSTPAFGAYANAGAPEQGLGWQAEPDGAAAAYARMAQGWIEAGATIVGGCCGTRPEHIAELARIAGALTGRGERRRDRS
ncbi:MAG TPA: homocysteine S-methyltransferase family protein [Polyangiaceae bacterium]|nr:homocysteine S-methyltransferase family protein [Polyangiaceae bacterium]